MLQKSINVAFFHAVVTGLSFMALFFISTRLSRSLRRRANMREAAQVARKCLAEIESQVDGLRNLRRKVVCEKGSHLSQMTAWEEEKKNFVTVRLNALLEEIRRESDRAAVRDQCLRFLDFMSSSSVPGQDGIDPNPAPDHLCQSEVLS